MISNCEKQFVLKCLKEDKRFDCRDAYSLRELTISFGVERGYCQVTLGETRVMSQVSCSIGVPRATRESEGTLLINVEIPAMAHRSFETGRQTDLVTEITRLLERAIRDSRCLDTESLCIIAGEKVWCIRVDIHILNHEGNILDAACISAMSSLVHFRRPDVTVSDGIVTLHSSDDKEPLPLSVYHWPVFVTFAWFEQGRYLLIDPSFTEEQCMEGKMVIAMNSHREVCALHVGGSMLILMEQVKRCCSIAVGRVRDITDCIKRALEDDQTQRKSGSKYGSAQLLSGAGGQLNEDEIGKLLNLAPKQHQPSPPSPEKHVDDDDVTMMSSNSDASDADDAIANIKSSSNVRDAVGVGGPSTWDINTKSDGSESEEDEVMILDTTESKGQQQLSTQPPGLAKQPPGLAKQPPGLAQQPPGLAKQPQSLQTTHISNKKKGKKRNRGKKKISQ